MNEYSLAKVQYIISTKKQTLTFPNINLLPLLLMTMTPIKLYMSRTLTNMKLSVMKVIVSKGQMGYIVT